MPIRFDRYYDNEMLASALEEAADAHPQLVSLGSLGESHEGRGIHLVTLTNRETGSPDEKPGFWVDANIHATEITGTAAALHLIDRLLRGYGEDAQITRLLDEQVFYIVPRLNPDGAALALADRPSLLRSGTRPYPFDERDDGLHSEDIDGDGRIMQMRIEDPAGDWKVSERDPRMMVKRGADEEGGQYYRLLPEGTVVNYDGYLLRGARSYQGLDFNRNFPGSWRPEGEQRGAGDYPGSEPEIRGVMDFFRSHPNIFGALTFHTFSRAILRPYGTRDDSEMDVGDLWVYEAIGERGTEITDYPSVSVYHHFRYHPKEVITGVFDDWLFDHKGIYAFTVELWDLATAAGVESKKKDKKFIEWFRKHPLEDDYKILEFVNEHHPEGLVEWRPFDHPQLGTVEIGGWDAMYTWRNPPPALLEAEVAPQSDFAIAFAAMAPRLAFVNVEVTPLGDDNYRLLAVVENRGFFGTHVSNQAKKMKAVRPVRLHLELPEGASLTGGNPKQEVGHLEGRSNKLSVSNHWAFSPTDNRAKAEWLIHAPQGGAVTVVAESERAGVLRDTVALGA